MTRPIVMLEVDGTIAELWLGKAYNKAYKVKETRPTAVLDFAFEVQAGFDFRQVLPEVLGQSHRS